MFLQVSVCPHRGGACMDLFGGCVWFYSGGVCGFIRGGGCMVLFRGACMVLFGGMRGFIWGGVCGFIRGACVVAPRGGMRGCSRGGCTWLLPGGHAWLLPGGTCVVAPRGGACVVFSMRYGQWAGGTHPTGMHSCLCFNQTASDHGTRWMTSYSLKMTLLSRPRRGTGHQLFERPASQMWTNPTDIQQWIVPVWRE